MRRCSKHATCRPVVNQPLPTRVLELSPTSRHKLIETRGLFGQYVILSHCWGSSDNMYKTTKDKLPALQQQLDTGALSRNFQDAILFTQRLGFKYLWIDALCIVQDDPADWEKEASSMGDYYNRSALMLSAAAAPDHASGFLHHRPQGLSPSFGTDRWFYVRPQILQEYALDLMPISKRAWTMQERYLAPRVIHFLPDQVFFECGNSSYSEGYFKNNMAESNFFSKLRIQKYIEPDLCLAEDRKRTPNMDPAPSRWLGQFHYDMWYECVRMFTSRNITFHSDRMPAIAGLAKKFSHPNAGAYLAGHWENDLFRSLCWTSTTRGRRGRSGGESKTPQAVMKYRGPSWSWVS
ncbi:HET-domain-containing protein, partial [Canariomyces notabilis]